MDTDKSADGRPIINNVCLALEAASMQWIESKKELSMKTFKSLTTLVTCMESPGLPVAKEN